MAAVTRPIRRLLVANRGEIAIRIFRACRELGIETVAVHSDADTDAPHVRAADLAIPIGPAPAAESYLKVSALIDAARRSGADAVHPGYGFLSERAAFADACASAGLLFVGPPAAAIERMGSKIGARALMERAGVPVVPGRTPSDQSDGGVAAAARAIGFPVLIKASAGGGGKGMRSADGDRALAEAIPAARREAQAAFGDGTLYVERLVRRPRHVEIQVFADAHGHVVHLFERECSVQRRHQKIVEESPSTALTPAVRRRMGAAAIAAARGVGYQNAGTIEFLLEGQGDDASFYFLEMNTRLQVEHPVTELVTGTDLVRAQLLVAMGHPLPWAQDDLAQRGHAIECRVYAEDPGAGFLPQAGPLRVYREPAGPGIRIDSGLVEGMDVPVQYDPMLAKLIAAGDSRQAAIARAISALRAFPILGVRTNVAFLINVLRHPAFAAGDVHTGFVDEHLSALLEVPPPPEIVVTAAAYARGARPAAAATTPAVDPWTTLHGWGR
ncbi:MAG TPA: acetyl-CoA carboxylase biotin carboxylase subunit [Vicinamibacterales bacterium]|nr:acetyl-CoA carboxylase biotin carboxylase subunit [Vicinamibacterales bacterium]